MPPFGLFISEFAILNGALGQQHYLAATIYLALLCVIFAGMVNSAICMVYRHEAQAPVQPAARTTALALIPPVGLAVLVLLLGLYLPAWLARVLALAAALVRGGAL
jgi:formate hydrogenlyase subunit 3/multisubunit Na+/H+ antiporter MnhD subunit